MKFTPKSDREIAEEGLFPAGTYDFEIASAEDTVSKSGNDMIKLGLRVFDQDGRTRMVTDYLLESMSYKLKHAAVGCGLGPQYDRGTLQANDFVGRSGQLKLRIKKDKEGNYPDQNAVSDYIVADTPAAQSKPTRQLETVDDEIPF